MSLVEKLIVEQFVPKLLKANVSCIISWCHSEARKIQTEQHSTVRNAIILHKQHCSVCKHKQDKTVALLKKALHFFLNLDFFFPMLPSTNDNDQYKISLYPVAHASCLFILLTHNIETAIEFGDSISSPSLAHLTDLHPLIQMWVKPLHTGKRCHAIIASHCINKVLAKRGQSRVHTVPESQLTVLCTVLPPGPQIPLRLWVCSWERHHSSSHFRCRTVPHH